MQIICEPNLIDKSTVLSHNEWKRIKSSSRQEKKLSEHQLLEEERKNKSNIISETWPNKIVDLRKKQLEARKLREEKQEKEKDQLDIQEAEFQSQRRKEIIENAKRQLYFQNDRIRRLHGALLLSQVMKERDLQIELNKKKAHMFDDIDAQYLQSIKKQEEDDVKEKQARERKNRIDKQRLAAELNNQITSKEIFERQMKEEIVKLGQELKEHDEWYIEELLRNLLDKQRQQKVLIEEQQRCHNEKQRLREIAERKNDEEHKKTELIAEAKRKLKQMKDAKEKQEFNEKQERLQRSREKIALQFATKFQDEEECYQKAVQEKEKKVMEDNERSRLARKQALADCLSHYKFQMERHQNQVKAAQKATAEELKRLQEDNELLQKDVLEKQRWQLEKQSRQHQMLAQQISERKEKTIKERAKEIAQDLRLYDELLMEEQFFQDYATNVLEEVKEKGYNTLPLLRAAEPGIGFGHGPVYKDRANIRPVYQASDSSGAPLQHILPKIRPHSVTAQRLGFWR